MNTEVLVVGGGISGLACAALLGRAGKRVTLLEASSAIGGLARTQERDGFALNRGAHALLCGGAAMEVLAALEIVPRGGRPKLSGVAFMDGRRHRLPTTPWGMLTTGLLSWPGRVSLARLFAGVARLEGGQGSAQQWVESVVEDASARAFLGAMLRLATYCGDLEAVRADVAVAALRQASQQGVFYLDGGWQQLVASLLEACTRADVQIRTRAPVETAVAGGVSIRGGEQIRASEVVLAVPPSVASRWVEVPQLHTARVACLDVALSARPDGPAFAFDLDDPMYLSVHGDAANLGPGTVVHTLHYGAAEDARPRLEGLLDRSLPRWRELCVHAQFLPRIAVTEGIVRPDGPDRPGVRAGGCWRVGDAVGMRGSLADAALGSAVDVARAILGAADTHAA